MKITVLGCGALGKLWLTALYKSGYDIQGWQRVPQPYCNVKLIDKDQFIFSKLFTTNNSSFLARSELLLVTLKAWQVSEAVRGLANIFPHTSPILLLHNGMGTLSELKNIVQPIIIGTTTHAVNTDGNIVIHVAKGTTHIGPLIKLKNNYRYLADKLHAALPNVIWNDTMKLQLWRKMAVNCVINPLTALWNCPNGTLRDHPNYIATLCVELAKVIECEGLHILAKDLYNYVDQVIISTAKNISSMLQDVRAMRHTEIDYITGYLLKRAHIHGIDLPENNKLYELIKLKELEYERINTN